MKQETIQTRAGELRREFINGNRNDTRRALIDMQSSGLAVLANMMMGGSIEFGGDMTKHLTTVLETVNDDDEKARRFEEVVEPAPVAWDESKYGMTAECHQLIGASRFGMVWCYSACTMHRNRDGNSFRLSVCDQGKAGYTPIHETEFQTFHLAHEAADALNSEVLKLTDSTAMTIVGDTMARGRRDAAKEAWGDVGTVYLSEQTKATVLAALRYYQEGGQGDPENRSDDIHDIATNGGDEVISLNAEAIDRLCEFINLS